LCGDVLTLQTCYVRGGGEGRSQSLYTLISSSQPHIMISRRCRNIIVGCLLIYLVVLLVYSNVAVFRKCSRCHDQTLLQFNFQVNKNGDQSTYLLDEENDFTMEDKLRIDRHSKLKSEEIIFINRNKYDGGVVQLDETTIKKSSDGGGGITVENLHKMYHAAVPSRNQNKEATNKVKVEPQQQNNRKKFIFSLRYYEQLSMATKNLLSLASLATHTNSHLVTPFVNNSRFSGLRLGASMSSYLEASKYNRSYLENDYNGGKFNSIDKYFDVVHLNRQLTEHGYTSLASFDEFQQQCRTLDTVIHFLYDDELTTRNIERWYKVPQSRSNAIVKRAKGNKGWTECDFVKRSKISQLLGNVNVTRYVCVDPEIITTPEQLQQRVLKNSSCTGIILWKGNGTKRTHFPLAPRISEPLRPWHLKHDRRLIDIAYRYIRDTIQRPFISVHVRSERHLIWKGIRAAMVCIKKLNKKVDQRKMKFNLKKIFLASDLVDYGSDTLLVNSNADDRRVLQTELMNGLQRPFTFNPRDYGLYDRGEIAIVEMHILSLGESLFTLGRGNFQEWISELFLLHNAEDKSLIYKICNYI